MTCIQIGQPWEMIAVDIQEVPVSYQGNRYLLVVQDYFTKWPEAIPLTDQTVNRITGELLQLCSRLGHPDTVYSGYQAHALVGTKAKIYALHNEVH